MNAKDYNPQIVPIAMERSFPLQWKNRYHCIGKDVTTTVEMIFPIQCGKLISKPIGNGSFA